MLQLVSDSFKRANENPLSDGGNWDVVHGGVSYASHRLLNNACIPTGAVNNANFFSGISWPSDQYAEVTLGSVTGLIYAALARCSSSAASFYKALLNALSQSVLLSVTNAGAATTLGSASGITPSVGDVIKVQAQGTTISLFYNGIQKVSVTDSTLSSGSAGLFTVYNQTPSDTAISAWDGGNLTSGASDAVGGSMKVQILQEYETDPRGINGLDPGTNGTRIPGEIRDCDYPAGTVLWLPNSVALPLIIKGWAVWVS